jgi:hypothetical protein
MANRSEAAVAFETNGIAPEGTQAPVFEHLSLVGQNEVARAQAARVRSRELLPLIKKVNNPSSDLGSEPTHESVPPESLKLIREGNSVVGFISTDPYGTTRIQRNTDHTFTYEFTGSNGSDRVQYDLAGDPIQTTTIRTDQNNVVTTKFESVDYLKITHDNPSGSSAVFEDRPRETIIMNTTADGYTLTIEPKQAVKGPYDLPIIEGTETMTQEGKLETLRAKGATWELGYDRNGHINYYSELNHDTRKGVIYQPDPNGSGWRRSDFIDL